MELGSRETLIRYILGDVSREQRERLEERYFINDEVWEELEAVEADLIDSYLRGELSKSQREQFERYFLASPRRRQRLDFARIQMAASSVPGQKFDHPWKLPAVFGRRLPQFAISVAVLLAVAAVMLAVQNVRLRGQLSRMQADQKTFERQLEELRQQVANGPAQNLPFQDSAQLFSEQSPTVFVLLTPGELRTGENTGNLLPISSSVRFSVVLLLELEKDRFPGYEVVLRKVDGKQIRRIEGLKSWRLPTGGKVVALSLPSGVFQRGDYIATLSGKTHNGKAEVIDSFTFTVIR